MGRTAIQGYYLVQQLVDPQYCYFHNSQKDTSFKPEFLAITHRRLLETNIFLLSISI